MLEPALKPPLARWDGLHLVLDMALVERHLRRQIETVERVIDLTLQGAGDAVRVDATVVWKGVRTPIRIELGELRLKRRFLGFRLRRLRALGGIHVPMGAVELLLRAVGREGVTVFRDQRIVVVDLRRWIPAELELTLLTVQATGSALHLWLGPGLLRDLPHRRPRALPATAGGGTSTT